MEDVQKHFNPKCNIALPALCRTDNLNCLLGWAEELDTLRNLYQEQQIKLIELQHKYEAAKKTADEHKLWAQREWQPNVVGVQNVLRKVEDKAQAALLCG